MNKYLTDFEIPQEELTLREGTALSNIDGRLWGEVGANVAAYLSDEAMVRARIGVEARYLIALSEYGIVRKLKNSEKDLLLNIHQKLDKTQYQNLRKVEANVRHDVMVMIQIMKNLLKKENILEDVIENWIHWGLTSFDVDDTAKACLIQNMIRKVYLPEAGRLLTNLADLAEKTKNTVIPAKTHLQPAVPTTLGKEVALFGMRLCEQLEFIKNTKLRGKLTGAVGTLAAHKAVFPNIDWIKFSKNFIESLGLEANLYTTQIEQKEKLVEIFSKIHLVNTILVDLSQDMRLMIGFDWLAQEVKDVEIGSSAMPQKVNPIDFENAQGNGYFSNWILEGLIRYLPVSWLQRDLTDKTILRNIGLPFGHAIITLISTSKGIKRVIPNIAKINKDLKENWGIISEGLQTYMRSLGIPDAYNSLKKLARGRQLTKKHILFWIENLDINNEEKEILRQITPQNYTGYAKENTSEMIRYIRKVEKLISKIYEA